MLCGLAAFLTQLSDRLASPVSGHMQATFRTPRTQPPEIRYIATGMREACDKSAAFGSLVLVKTIGTVRFAATRTIGDHH
jgi:hypothetical protein